MSFTPRISSSGAYRDCRWCHGVGCVSCEVEAEKEYKRQFPDGPKPIATFERKPGESSDDLLGRALSSLGVALKRCPNDTNGDGDCAQCAHTGGCKFIHAMP